MSGFRPWLPNSRPDVPGTCRPPAVHSFQVHRAAPYDATVTARPGAVCHRAEAQRCPRLRPQGCTPTQCLSPTPVPVC